MSQSSYLGAFGYNESPEALGEPGGFWAFADYDVLEAAYQSSSSLDAVFEDLGLPTFSKILWVVDQQGQTLFHVLVLSARDDLPLRAYDLMEQTVTWLMAQGYTLPEAHTLSVAGVQRETLEKRKHEHEAHVQQFEELNQQCHQQIRLLRFLSQDHPNENDDEDDAAVSS